MHIIKGACKQYYSTKYARLPDLPINLEIARADGAYKKAMAKYATPLVPILDEWLLLKPTDVGRILRTFKIKKNVEVTDNGKDDF